MTNFSSCKLWEAGNAFWLYNRLRWAYVLWSFSIECVANTEEHLFDKICQIEKSGIFRVGEVICKTIYSKLSLI